MTRKTRPISWIKAARKDFEQFPLPVQSICLAALTIASEGGKADIVKPFKGLGSGIFEIAFARRGVARRFVSSMAFKLTRIFGCFTHFKRSRRKESKRLIARWS